MARNLATSTRYQALGMSKGGKKPKEIAEALNMHVSSVYRIINRAADRDECLEDKERSGCPVSKLTKRNIDLVRKRVQRAPMMSLRALSRALKFNLDTTCRLVARAGFKSMSKLVVHELMPGQIERRLARAQGLLAWRMAGMNKFRTIVWTDEKKFVLQLHHNRKNDRILVPVAAHDPSLRLVVRRKNPSSVMVFGAMASNGVVMDPIFIPSGITITSKSYQELILPKLLSWMEEKFGLPTGFRGEEGVGKAVLMQDGAPAHTSNSTQQFLVDNLGKNNFWAKDKWPPSSPDANPLDFSFWNELAAAVTGPGVTVPQNRQSLIRPLEETWHQVLEPSYVRKTCYSAWARLQRIVDANGGYIERIRTAATAEDVPVDENNNETM